ncbi:MAG TPA: hypothetical protein VGO59_16435 [Verrucomicrobiae bacterium]|jgi:hypothetical protein
MNSLTAPAKEPPLNLLEPIVHPAPLEDSLPAAAPSAAAVPLAESEPSELADLRRANAELQAQLNVIRGQLQAEAAKKAADAEEEKLITARMEMGLKREQAVAATRRQKAFMASDYGKMVRARHEARQGFRPAAAAR